jgi:hypothetical protein
MTYEEAIDVLRSWAGRSVIAVMMRDEIAAAEMRSGGPVQGRLELRDMWPDVDPSDNPQRKGEVEFVNVMRPERRADLVNPTGATFALYRSVFVSARALHGGRGIAFLTRGPLRVDFWLDE